MIYDRQVEINRYVKHYENPEYAMGIGRQRKAKEVLEQIRKLVPVISPGLLDVGSGRGELLDIALLMDFRVVGIDPAVQTHPQVRYGIATEIPFANETFDVVTCLDVLEHLIPADVEPALHEMKRVVKRDGILFLSAAEGPSVYGDGYDLHISKRPRAKWEELLNQVFEDYTITYVGDCSPSPGWTLKRTTQ